MRAIITATIYRIVESLPRRIALIVCPIDAGKRLPVMLFFLRR
jgi:hypothetical protein